jgi:BirA family biotin operon repressor/biotin-[acetyl-CoA-carboxylase] ligase
VLTASFVMDLRGVDDSRPLVPSTRLSLAAGLAVAHAISDLMPQLSPRIKWPNDVLIEQRKVAGILCETRARSDGSKAAVIGIGCNLAPRWDLDHASLPLATGRMAP